MLTRRARIALPAAVMVVALTNPCAEKAARAQSAKACTALAEDAQRLRADGRLVEAREKLTACSVPACPQVVRSDCAQWATEVVAATPTIIIDAKDEKGADIADAKVFVDHRPVADRIDGRPIAVNPGQHVIRVDRANGESTMETIVAKESAKDRPITISFGAPVEKREAGRDSSDKSSANDGAFGWGQYTGIGLVALGAVLITYAAVSYSSYEIDESDLKDKFDTASDATKGCALDSPPETACGKNVATRERLRGEYEENEIDAKNHRALWLLAGIGGTVAVAGGVVLFIIAPRGSSSSLRGAPVITPQYAGMSLGGSF